MQTVGPKEKSRKYSKKLILLPVHFPKDLRAVEKSDCRVAEKGGLS